MLAIFDTFDLPTRELLHSLETAGIAVTPLFVHYDGELPEGALSPFASWTGLERRGEPLFFNEVPVPAWCEIRQEREPFGEILRDGERIGRINYEPGSFRQVQSVDWLLPGGAAGGIRSHTDHYDRYGNRYATSYYDDGAPYQTVYRGPARCEIELNHVSRTVTLRAPGRLLTFPRLADFVSHFIDEQGLDDSRVLINSLSHPLFVMRQRAARPNTTLFWQEPMPGGVPENMATELEEPRALERIVFREEQLLRKVAARHPRTPVELDYLSPIGQFAEHLDYDPGRAFVLTHSDDLPALVELLEAFPEATFSVAALTLMSEKLHALGRRYPNLRLTPGITHRGIREELARASVYLDINAGGQVLDVVKAAYLLNLVVLALGPLAKDPEHSRVIETTQELRAELAAVFASADGRARALEALHAQHGPESTAADYRRMLAERKA